MEEGMAANEIVKKGNTVEVEYTGKFDDGTVFDASANHGQPLSFTLGSQEVIPGFEHAVEGMKVGEEKKVTIPPEEGYGERSEQLVKNVPRQQLPAEPEPQVGMMLLVRTPEGQEFPTKITAVKDGMVTIDLNHPLAGKTLHFTLKLVRIAG